MPPDSEQKIIDLSAKVVALQNTREFWPAVHELREAIHDHLSSVGDKVADLAFLIANENDKAA